MTTSYEWDVETYDEHGDIIDHSHSDKLSESRWPKILPDERLVLVRDSDSAAQTYRAWAYVDPKTHQLPEFFTFPDENGVYQPTTYRVPKRFQEEINRELKRVSMPT